MSDSGFDLLIYIALTIGASALSLLKSSKEKKAKAARQEIPIPEEEELYEPEPVVIMQQPEVTNAEEVFIPIQNDDRFSEKMKEKKEEGITGFGRTDEERYAMLEKLQQEGRVSHKKQVPLFKEDEETEDTRTGKENSGHFEFDLRQAIIASEILNRKY